MSEDLSGVWYGRYSSTEEPQQNSFIALIEETGGALFGSMSERDPYGSSAILRAIVNGTHSCSQVRFVKRYDGSGGWQHSVHYSGTVVADATEIGGTWFVEGIRGSFAMQREKFTEEELEAEEEELFPLVLDRPEHD